MTAMIGIVGFVRWDKPGFDAYIKRRRAGRFLNA